MRKLVLLALISDLESSFHSAISLTVFKEVPVKKKELVKKVLLVRERIMLLESHVAFED